MPQTTPQNWTLIMLAMILILSHTKFSYTPKTLTPLKSKTNHSKKSKMKW